MTVQYCKYFAIEMRCVLLLGVLSLLLAFVTSKILIESP